MRKNVEKRGGKGRQRKRWLDTIEIAMRTCGTYIDVEDRDKMPRIRTTIPK